MNDRRNLLFNSWLTLDSIHHERSILHATQIKPLMCMFFQNRTSKRTEPFTTLDCIHKVFALWITRIIQDRTIAQSTRTSFCTTLEERNNILRSNQIYNVFVSCLTDNTTILISSLNDLIQSIIIRNTMIQISNLCRKFWFNTLLLHQSIVC